MTSGPRARLSPCLLLLLACACRADSGPCAPGVAPLPGRIQRGMSFVHSMGDRGYGTATSAASLRELRELGVDWISLMPFGFMAALGADEIHLAGHHGAGETDDRIASETRAAHALGRRPPSPTCGSWWGEWSGRIAPEGPGGWTRWFASYRHFTLHYAQLAQQTSADMLTVGVELGSSSQALAQTQAWRALIAEVRAVYNKGPLTYAANWDEAPRVPFWDALDYIGVQFYAPLADGPDTPDEALARRLKERLDSLAELARAARKPVLFTEVGYKSVRGTAIEPSLWPEQLRGGAVQADHAAQAQAYRVFLQGIRDRDWVAGTYFWKWFSYWDSAEEGPSGFSPRRKPAAAILRSAYGGRCGASPISHQMCTCASGARHIGWPCWTPNAA